MRTPEPIRATSMVPVEARAHQGRRAGLVSRTLAAGVDLAVVICLLVSGYVGWVVGLFILDPRSFAHPQPTFLPVVAAYLLVAISYLAVCWTVTGRSFGQHVLGLRVTDREGHRLHLGHACLRAAFCVGFPIGLLWAVFSTRGGALHDLVLSTTVTYDWTTWQG